LELIEGLLRIANLFLSIVAGILAITLFKISHKKEYSNPWKVLMITLVVFAINQILNAIRAFDIYPLPYYITEIVPTIIIALMITAVVMQIYVSKGK